MDNSHAMEINTILKFGWDYTEGTFSPFCDGDESFSGATRPEVGLEVLPLQQKEEKEGGVQRRTLYLRKNHEQRLKHGWQRA